jgi:hypothetical protein
MVQPRLEVYAGGGGGADRDLADLKRRLADVLLGGEAPADAAT